MSSPGISPNNMPSLINAAPGVSNTNPGAQPVTGYNPAEATSSPTQTTSYNPSTYSVTPEQTVAGQIKRISPLRISGRTPRFSHAGHWREQHNGIAAVGLTGGFIHDRPGNGCRV